MTACGQLIRPTLVKFEIETYPSSTRPALVETDVGQGYIKGITNPAGTCALVSELIASELGTWFGLNIPAFAIVERCDIDIQMQIIGTRIEPPCFYSHRIDGALSFDNTNLILSKLRNKKDISKLIIFDTWIRNSDRFFEESSNYDNLLFSRDRETGLYLLNPIDHSHCFSDTNFLDDLPDENCETDDRIYGMFPQFDSYLLPEAVDEALSHLRTLSRDFVEACVNQIPPQWNATKIARKALVDLICNRASYVVSTISTRLLTSPGLPGIGA